MNKISLSKKVHEVLRNAGYERQTNRIWVSPNTYRSMWLSNKMWIYIPGNWSIPIIAEYEHKLMSILKEFYPEKTQGSPAGIMIYLEKVS